jgi:hypothetical protein
MFPSFNTAVSSNDLLSISVVVVVVVLIAEIGAAVFSKSFVKGSSIFTRPQSAILTADFLESVVNIGAMHLS